jgi:hypothetical protein
MACVLASAVAVACSGSSKNPNDLFGPTTNDGGAASATPDGGGTADATTGYPSGDDEGGLVADGAQPEAAYAVQVLAGSFGFKVACGYDTTTPSAFAADHGAVGPLFDSRAIGTASPASPCGTGASQEGVAIEVMIPGTPPFTAPPGSFDLSKPSTPSSVWVRVTLTAADSGGTPGPTTEYGSWDTGGDAGLAGVAGTVIVHDFETGDATGAGHRYDVELTGVTLPQTDAAPGSPFPSTVTVAYALLH